MSRSDRKPALEHPPITRLCDIGAPKRGRRFLLAVAGGILLGLAAVVSWNAWLERYLFWPDTRVASLGPIQTNSAGAPETAPEDMVWVPGGTFWMGSDEFADAQPRHKVYVDGFWMDKTEVTNAAFREFVNKTGYVTTAEKAPELSDLMRQVPPGTPPPPKESLVAGSLVFTTSSGKVPLDNVAQWWKWTPGASWRHPEGPGSDLAGREKHPVVHVSYDDALAYCAWRSKKGGTFRLPTEAEWEFAARGGLDRKTFILGNDLKLDGKLMANTWQGEFPYRNTKEDGFAGTAPVASYPPNGYGLHDMAGNVWEWCGDWYHVNYYTFTAKRNPTGPRSSHDPTEPTVAKRVQRGGSYLCSDEYCKRYVPGARGKGDPHSTTNHIGFRCVTAVK